MDAVCLYYSFDGYRGFNMSKVKAIYSTVEQIKQLKSRGVCQIIIELPIEYYKEAVTEFCDEQVLVVKRDLDQPYGIINGATEPKPKRGKTLSQEAYKLTITPSYHEWMNMKFGHQIQTQEEADHKLKQLLNVQSKSEIDEDSGLAKVFENHMEQYKEWLDGTKVQGMPNGV